jgi:hypothetical protein
MAEERSRQRQPATDLAGDRLAARALNAASLGLFLFPVGLHVYSACLLLRLRLGGLPLSEGGRRQAREARRLNLIMLLGAACCLGLGLYLVLGR